MSKFPTLLGGVKPQGEKSFQSEREILYQVLFDLRRDVTELKKLVHDIMAERAAGGTVTAPSSMPVHYIPETPSSLIQPSAVVLNPAEEVGKVSSVSSGNECVTSKSECEGYTCRCVGRCAGYGRIH